MNASFVKKRSAAETENEGRTTFLEWFAAIHLALCPTPARALRNIGRALSVDPGPATPAARGLVGRQPDQKGDEIDGENGHADETEEQAEARTVRAKTRADDHGAEKEKQKQPQNGDCAENIRRHSGTFRRA